MLESNCCCARLEPPSSNYFDHQLQFNVHDIHLVWCRVEHLTDWTNLAVVIGFHPTVQGFERLHHARIGVVSVEFMRCFNSWLGPETYPRWGHFKFEVNVEKRCARSRCVRPTFDRLRKTIDLAELGQQSKPRRARRIFCQNTRISSTECDLVRWFRGVACWSRLLR
jgi:hypothetical protein